MLFPTDKEGRVSNKRHSNDYISSAHYKYFLTESILVLRGAQRLIPYALISESLLEMQEF